MVKPKLLEEALGALKRAGNPFYQMEFDRVNAYRERCMEDDPRGAGVVFPELAEDSDSDDEMEQEGFERDERQYNEKEDPVKRNQLVEVEEGACMIQNNPEVDRRVEDSVVSVAPGEGRRPEGWLMDKNWDVQAYPST